MPEPFNTGADWQCIAILNTVTSAGMGAFALQWLTPSSVTIQLMLILLPFWALGIAVTIHFLISLPLLRKFCRKKPNA